MVPNFAVLVPVPAAPPAIVPPPALEPPLLEPPLLEPPLVAPPLVEPPLPPSLLLLQARAKIAVKNARLSTDFDMPDAYHDRRACTATTCREGETGHRPDGQGS
jgi:hypothetical protein